MSKITIDNVFFFVIFFTLFVIMLARHFTLKKLKNKLLLALDNENFQRSNTPIMAYGYPSGNGSLRSAYSNTSVVASKWSISSLQSGGKQRVWEIEKLGNVGESFEMVSKNGRRYGVSLDQNTILSFDPTDFSSMDFLVEKTQIESDAKIDAFAMSNNIDPKNSVGINNIFGSRKKLRISEWNIVSGTPYSILGILGSDNRIIGTADDPVTIYSKTPDQIVAETKTKYLRSYLLIALFIAILIPFCFLFIKKF